MATFATLLLSALLATQGYAGVGLALAAWIAMLLGLRLRRCAWGWRKAAALGLTVALITEAVAVAGRAPSCAHVCGTATGTSAPGWRIGNEAWHC